MLFLQKRRHQSTCEHLHHNHSWFCCLCTSANRYWLTYCSISVSFSSSKSLVYRTWGKKTTWVLNTENDRILLQHNGTQYYKQQPGVSSCLKSKYFSFFLNNKVYVLQNSATFRFGGGRWRTQHTCNWNCKELFFEWRLVYQYTLLSELELSTCFWFAEIPTNIHR